MSNMCEPLSLVPMTCSATLWHCTSQRYEAKRGKYVLSRLVVLKELARRHCILDVGAVKRVFRSLLCSDMATHS